MTTPARLPPGTRVTTQGGRPGIVESYVPSDATVKLHDCPSCACCKPSPFADYAIVRWLDAERLDGGCIRFLSDVVLAKGYRVPEHRQVRSYEWPPTMTAAE